MIKQIFLDMDGVLADFDSAKQKLQEEYALGRALEKNEMWTIIHSEFPYWFYNLPVMADAVELYRWAIEKVEIFNTAILTAVGRTNSMEVARQKTAWIRFNLDHDATIIPCRRKHKKAWATPESLLIDDNEQNCLEFREAGGHAILYTGFEDCKQQYDNLVNS